MITGNRKTNILIVPTIVRVSGCTRMIRFNMEIRSICGGKLCRHAKLKTIPFSARLHKGRLSIKTARSKSNFSVLNFTRCFSNYIDDSGAGICTIKCRTGTTNHFDTLNRTHRYPLPENTKGPHEISGIITIDHQQSLKTTGSTHMD